MKFEWMWTYGIVYLKSLANSVKVWRRLSCNRSTQLATCSPFKIDGCYVRMFTSSVDGILTHMPRAQPSRESEVDICLTTVAVNNSIAFGEEGGTDEVWALDYNVKRQPHQRCNVPPNMLFKPTVGPDYPKSVRDDLKDYSLTRMYTVQIFFDGSVSREEEQRPG
jgi:hypothetical protein